MNMQQRDYLNKRIYSIRKRKGKELEDKYTKKGSVESDIDRWKLVLAGKVKPIKDIRARSSCSSCNSYYLRNMFDFSAYADKVDQKRLDVAILKLDEETQKVRDKAMHGDCDEAVKLLAEYEKS